MDWLKWVAGRSRAVAHSALRPPRSFKTGCVDSSSQPVVLGFFVLITCSAILIITLTWKLQVTCMSLSFGPSQLPQSRMLAARVASSLPWVSSRLWSCLSRWQRLFLKHHSLSLSFPWNLSSSLSQGKPGLCGASHRPWHSTVVRLLPPFPLLFYAVRYKSFTLVRK